MLKIGPRDPFRTPAGAPNILFLFLSSKTYQNMYSKFLLGIIALLEAEIWNVENLDPLCPFRPPYDPHLILAIISQQNLIEHLFAHILGGGIL